MMVRDRRSLFLRFLTAVAILFFLVNVFTNKAKFLFSRSVEEDHLRSAKVSVEDLGAPKIILFWTKFFGESNSYMYEEGDRIRLKQCPMSNCILSENRSLWNESAAFFFHPLDFNQNELPPERYPHQYYVHFVLESPQHSSSVEWANFYNLTFTYRFDSDCIADNYIQYFRPKLLKTRAQFTEIWKKKINNRAAIFVSNCGGSSRRMEYVQQLNKYYPVDIYGGCGNLSCPRWRRDVCDSLIKTYKFYLSFENSICRDYISEKSVRGYMADTIPVFLGGVNYSTIFPPKSFLNVLEFSSPEELAKEMHRISGDEEVYLEYLEFRYDDQLNRLPDFLQPENVSLCKLCEILNAKEPLVKTYLSMPDWWNAAEDCIDPPWTTNADQNFTMLTEDSETDDGLDLDFP